MKQDTTIYGIQMKQVATNTLTVYTVIHRDGNYDYPKAYFFETEDGARSWKTVLIMNHGANPGDVTILEELVDTVSGDLLAQRDIT